MPIRYHAQRKHIIHSLDSLLYELHTLSFLLAPSLLILLCRCATQFQFARARDIDNKRGLSFWLLLVVLVNVGGVWAHASSGAGDYTKSVVLDFVGMGHRPSKLQLLLLDATIMLLQALLTIISYETSLALAMPENFQDPLLPIPAPSSVPSSPITPITNDFNSESSLLPTSYPPSNIQRTASSNSNTYPPSSTSYPPTDMLSASSPLNHLSSPSSTLSPLLRAFKPPPIDSLPPSIPIIDLSIRHFVHRLTSPTPQGATRVSDGLDGEGDELSVLRLPLPNTTSVRLAHTLRLLAQARQRRRERDRQEARIPRGGAGEGVGTTTTDSEGDASRGRIPGAMDDED